ncbi:hypothetical protein GOP47_0007896, partial [Adiantum capillus-veneris]
MRISAPSVMRRGGVALLVTSFLTTIKPKIDCLATSRSNCTTELAATSNVPTTRLIILPAPPVTRPAGVPAPPGETPPAPALPAPPPAPAPARTPLGAPVLPGVKPPASPPAPVPAPLPSPAPVLMPGPSFWLEPGTRFESAEAGASCWWLCRWHGQYPQVRLSREALEPSPKLTGYISQPATWRSWPLKLQKELADQSVRLLIMISSGGDQG